MTINEKPMSQILPPPEPPGPIKWLKDNLFGTITNSFLSITSIALTLFLGTRSIQWLLAAKWTPVTEFALSYVVGNYPRESVWRVAIALSLVIFLLGVSWGKWGGLLQSISFYTIAVIVLITILPPHPHLELSLNIPLFNIIIDISIRYYLTLNILFISLGYLLGRSHKVKPSVIAISWVIAPIIIMMLFSGFKESTWLNSISTTEWGGLMVTFLLAFGGIILSFPIGVALALGRRSTLPMVRIFSTFFIETIRGVPLVTILFVFSQILNLFLPAEASIDRLMKSLMALVFFSSAYMAENIRGGLQSIPSGQEEAAKALGMNSFQIMFFIIMPQALRAVIPAIVGQFIGLFKDTTLVSIVGILDLLGMGQSIINGDSAFLFMRTQVYIFIAAIYWIFSYLMSVASRKVETTLGVGTR
jgi:general L-amino acid transport system permease protein